MDYRLSTSIPPGREEKKFFSLVKNTLKLIGNHHHKHAGGLDSHTRYYHTTCRGVGNRSSPYKVIIAEAETSLVACGTLVSHPKSWKYTHQGEKQNSHRVTRSI
jgi:hypothetical protein